MIDNVTRILAIEWLAAAQGIEFLRPLNSSTALESAHSLLRSFSPSMMTDRSLAPDIEQAAARIADGALGRIFRGRPDMPPLWVPA
jgi:histidine ammonia-lyase